MGVDTREALGAEAPPPPPDFQVPYYTLYTLKIMSMPMKKHTAGTAASPLRIAVSYVHCTSGRH